MSKPLNNDHPDVQRVREAAQALGEHFDSVQIFATRCEQGELDGTVNVHIGVGNWFTRYGQVQDWLVKQDEMTRVGVRRDEAEPGEG